MKLTWRRIVVNAQYWKSIHGHPKSPWHLGSQYWVWSFKLFQYHFYYFNRYFTYSICNYKRQKDRFIINLLISSFSSELVSLKTSSIRGSRWFSQVEVFFSPASIPMQIQRYYPFSDSQKLNMEWGNSKLNISHRDF